jgi:hypothetical protein
MDQTKPQPSTPEMLTQPEPQPIQVVQFADGYMAIFSKRHIAFGGGESPYASDSSSDGEA